MHFKYYVKLFKYENDNLVNTDEFGYTTTNYYSREYMISKIIEILGQHKENCTCTINQFDATIIAGNIRYVIEVKYIYN